MIIEPAAEAAMFRPDKQLRFLDLAVWGESVEILCVWPGDGLGTACGDGVETTWGLGTGWEQDRAGEKLSF
jgi:hypothetical protein